MAHKLPSREYLTMLDIKYIVSSWQNLSYSDKEAIRLIQLVITEGPANKEECR